MTEKTGNETEKWEGRRIAANFELEWQTQIKANDLAAKRRKESQKGRIAKGTGPGGMTEKFCDRKMGGAEERNGHKEARKKVYVRLADKAAAASRFVRKMGAEK